ncbi:MAG TPA: J domain-containing protein [Thermoanaerobaculia bacterium]|nr:J domain-containing protein [Thermoanaerobaculia bacterium]
MRLDDGYRLLDLDPTASDEEVKTACRDLTKVWHPDRFGSDPRLREKAEEKLKAILEACETIRSSRAAGAAKTRERDGKESRDDGTLAGKPPGDGGGRVRRYGARALFTAAVAVFVLLRRPTPAGLVVALALLGLSAWFVARMRAAEREARGPG